MANAHLSLRYSPKRSGSLSAPFPSEISLAYGDRSGDGCAPRVFELPRDAVVEVPLVHPVFDWFADLGLKWHAVPALSGMRLEIGGVSYTAAPFNGWYMGTEIGARDFGDASRYNVLPLVAEKMGLDRRSEHSLWIDRALLEMNVAVNHSFAKARISLVDHHMAARHFMRHIEREGKARRAITGQWNWLVPPMSGSTTPVFHRGYKNSILKPSFFYQVDPWSGSSRGIFSVASAILLRNRGFHVD